MILSHSIFNGFNSIEILSLVQSVVVGLLLIYSFYVKKIPSLFLALLIIYDGIHETFDIPLVSKYLESRHYFAFVFFSLEAPLYWLFSKYIKDITSPLFKKWTDLYLVIMIFEIILFSCIYFFFPSFIDTLSYNIIKLLISLSSIAIFALLLRSLKQHQALVLKQYSDAREKNLQWLYNAIIAWLITYLIFITLDLIFVYTDADHTSTYLQFIAHCLNMFFVFYLYHYGSKQKQVTYFFKKESQENTVKTTSTTEDIELSFSLKKIIEDEKLYLTKGITINEISSKVNLSPATISVLINQNYNTNFNSFINEFRIDLAKKYLLDPDFKNYTIDAIGKECGFKSKTSFYAAFKRITGLTPSQFKKNNS